MFPVCFDLISDTWDADRLMEFAIVNGIAGMLIHLMDRCGSLSERSELANHINSDDCGTTLLMIASETRQPDMVRLLTEHGAHIDCQDDSGETAIMKACENGDEAVVLLLLGDGADISLQSHVETPPAPRTSGERDTGLSQISLCRIGPWAGLAATSERCSAVNAQPDALETWSTYMSTMGGHYAAHCALRSRSKPCIQLLI